MSEDSPRADSIPYLMNASDAEFDRKIRKRPSEDSAVARVEAYLANCIDERNRTIAGHLGRNADEDVHIFSDDLRELVAAARAWEAHTCGEAEIREKVAQEIEAVDPWMWGLAGHYAGVDAARIARGSAGGAS